MDKLLFEEYQGMLFCESCNKMVPKTHMNPRRVKPNYIVSKCNVDMWFDRHKTFVVPDGFTLEEIKQALHYFIYTDVCILNEIALSINKPLELVIKLYEYLNIKGKHVKIKTNCACCGIEIVCNPIAYKVSDNNYCSRQCYANAKSKAYEGEHNPNYIRIQTTCSNCGKAIKVIPYDYNKVNSYGDNHNFCSQKCYWQFRSKYYVQEKTYTYHHEYTPEEKEALRNGLLKRLTKEDRLNTQPQQIVNSILNNLQIPFEREKIFDYYAVDNYLPLHKGIIEVMGDYWHTNPLIYNGERKIDQIQQKQIHRDKIKISYLSSHYDYPILYLWESDIKDDTEKCAELILAFKQSLITGIGLPNYHSFNWVFNTTLSIKQSIIPYQSRDINEYRDLFLLQNA